MKVNLPADVTLADVVDRLDKPEEYVRLALANLHQATQKEPEAKLTIGTMGEGKAPNYKIDVPMELLRLDDGDPIFINKTPAVFHGRSHQPASFQPKEVKEINWSTRSMDLDQLKELIGHIRTAKRVRPDA